MDPKTGLYSKAAKIIRSLPQERGSVDQMIGAARKLGLRDAELEHAGSLPTGKVTKEELAQIFEARLPKLRIDQLGENPSYLSSAEQKERLALMQRKNDWKRQNPLSPEEEARHDELTNRLTASPNVLSYSDEDNNEELVDTEYGGYASQGTQNYRERLLKLPDQKKHPVTEAAGRVERARDNLQHHEGGYGPDHPITQQSRDILAKHEQALEEAKRLHGDPRQQGTYQSSHWSSHPNVLAHIRLSDRTVGEDREAIRPTMDRLAQMAGVDNPRDLGSGSVHVGLQRGVITPEEAASVSRLMGWHTGHENKRGIGKRLLHVEELQSDWAQEGREKGFYDPAKPYQVFDWGKEKPLANYASEEEALEHIKSLPADAELSLRNMSTTNRPDMPPVAPYVGNTQHWTDLALKNVLREAALGGYDGIVFPSGQNQADRYGLEKQMDLLKYDPRNAVLTGSKDGVSVIKRLEVAPEDLPGLVGHDITSKLLHPDNTFTNGNTGDQYHLIEGDDLKMGGGGMKGYYDGIVPKSVMKLAQMHDPSIKPAENVSYGEDGQQYQGFHLPMTDSLRQGILKEGFPAMKRGGSVDAALAATRRFTKDGHSAILSLKS